MNNKIPKYIRPKISSDPLNKNTTTASDELLEENTIQQLKGWVELIIQFRDVDLLSIEESEKKIRIVLRKELKELGNSETRRTIKKVILVNRNAHLLFLDENQIFNLLVTP